MCGKLITFMTVEMKEGNKYCYLKEIESFFNFGCHVNSIWDEKQFGFPPLLQDNVDVLPESINSKYSINIHVFLPQLTPKQNLQQGLQSWSRVLPPLRPRLQWLPVKQLNLLQVTCVFALPLHASVALACQKSKKTISRKTWQYVLRHMQAW